VPKSPRIHHFTADTTSHFSPSPPPPVSKHRPYAKASPAKPAHESTDIFEQAIQWASSHEQPVHRAKRKKSHKKKLAYSAASLSIALILGALVYVNMPYIRFRMAASHAGFAASMPASRPAGYKLSQLDAAKGAVALRYSQTAAKQSFSITERTSEWNSQALREMFVVGTASDYTTVESGGRTIYLYGNGNATWVNGGVWYLVESNDSLNNQQLVDLAKSL
jgi:hypothetical protein